MSKKYTLSKRWLIANLAVLLAILLLWSGCDTASSMYVTNTAATPLFIEVANADEFPAGGGGGLGDMLKSVYDPDEDGVFALNVLTGDVIDVSETSWAVSAMGAKANSNALNHDRYADSEAVSAMGAKANSNALNHDRYADSEAVSAMGAKANNNALNHDKYTDAEAKAAGATNKLDDFAAPDNNTDLNATTSAHGLLPLLTGVTTVYLNGNGAWTTPGSGGGLGYALMISGNVTNPVDATTYYLGANSGAWGVVAAIHRVYIPKSGTITVVYLYWYAAPTAGSDEGINIYIRLNNSSDTLIATVGSADVSKIFANVALSLGVAQGDYIEIKVITPTWGTNPATVIALTGVVYIE